jgi:cell division protein FtsZ
MHGVQSITDLMVRPGLINLDFADVETVMASMGKAMMGTGEAEGEGRALKAAEMAVSNPLIDDYTLKGAKGLLVNITGGKDLKLFEVDEAVNKVRAEVDSEAELIIGAITDAELDGKMRVSIVATSLDGQQPETKSVINMVHRIQNRNPGYSDFSNIGSSASFNFSNSISNPVSHGANALKLENEIVQEQHQEHSNSNVSNEETIHSNNFETESVVEDGSVNEMEKSFTQEAMETPQEQAVEENIEEDASNDLKEFGVDSDAPDLFSSETENSSSDDLLSSSHEEEDDLEIPAFLRRQKN